MRKKILITETRTVNHEILVDCKDDEAAANLDIELDEYTEDCGSWDEVKGLFENIDGVEIISKAESVGYNDFEYEEMEEC